MFSYPRSGLNQGAGLLIPSSPARGPPQPLPQTDLWEGLNSQANVPRLDGSWNHPHRGNQRGRSLPGCFRRFLPDTRSIARTSGKSRRSAGSTSLPGKQAFWRSRLLLNCLPAEPQTRFAAAMPTDEARPQLHAAELARLPAKPAGSARLDPNFLPCPLIGWTRGPRSVVLLEFGGRGERRSLSPAIL